MLPANIYVTESLISRFFIRILSNLNENNGDKIPPFDRVADRVLSRFSLTINL